LSFGKTIGLRRKQKLFNTGKAHTLKQWVALQHLTETVNV